MIDSFPGINNINSTTTINFGPYWSSPEQIQWEEFPDSIELTYKQHSIYNVHPHPPTEWRAVKIIYSCVDGKWNKSEPIYGKVIPAQDEYYEFED